MQLTPWLRQKNYCDRRQADEANNQHVVAVGDEAKPAKGVADIRVGAMRATNSELASAPHAWTLPAKQGTW